VVDHVIAGAVDHPGLQDRVRQSGAADDLLGLPLRLVVAGAAVGTGAEEAHHDEASDTGAAGGFDDGGRPLHVHAAEGLVADLPVDPGAVGHGVAPDERCGQRIDVRDVRAGASGDHHGLLQAIGEGATDESTASGDGDLHGVLLR